MLSPVLLAPAMTAPDLTPYLSQQTLVLAVSGGSDSLALLHLAHRAVSGSGNHSARLVAVTIDHALRPESASESRMVAQLCAALGIEHQTMVWSGDKPATGLAMAARLARHRLLAEAARSLGARVVLTGHTRDDQAETVLMRGQRGDGRGLAGIAPATLFEQEIWFARPLLHESRETLRDFLRGEGAGWIDDPSNDNPAYERVRWRQHIAGAPDREAKVAEAIRIAEAAGRARAEMAARIAERIDAHVRLVDQRLNVDWASLEKDDPAAAIETLRVLLAVVGGAQQLPALDKTRQLVERLSRAGGRHSLARVVVSRRSDRLSLVAERRTGAPLPPAPTSPWAHFLPSFDLEAARTVARLLGLSPLPALPGT